MSSLFADDVMFYYNVLSPAFKNLSAAVSAGCSSRSDVANQENQDNSHAGLLLHSNPSLLIGNILNRNKPVNEVLRYPTRLASNLLWLHD